MHSVWELVSATTRRGPTTFLLPGRRNVCIWDGKTLSSVLYAPLSRMRTMHGPCIVRPILEPN